MTFLIVLGIYFVALAFLVWASRRMPGAASLTLCAGAVLARLWTDSLTPLVAQTGVIIVSPPLSSLVAVALTLLPAFLILGRGPKVGKHHHGILGSLLFAALAVMLTYGAFSNAVVFDSGSRHIVELIMAQEKWITTGAIILAIIEVLVFHKPHSLDEHGRSHKKF